MAEKKRAAEAAQEETYRKDNDFQRNTQEKSDILSSIIEEQAQFQAEVRENDFSGGWDKVFSWEIDSRVDYPSPNHLIRCGKIGFFPTGNVHSISARSKQGKTFLVTIFASVILGNRFADLIPEKNDAKILVFDTEQDVSDVAIVKKRIALLNGDNDKENSHRFKVIPVRGIEINALLQFIENTIKGLKPTAVFIDNVADLARNFNDNVEADALLKKIMDIAGENKCSIICVIHENPTGDTGKMKGHIGTLLKQKLASSFTIKKEGALFKVTQTDSRHGEIEPFSFVLDENLIPTSAQNLIERREEDNKEAIKNKFMEAFGNHSVLPQKDLIAKMKPIFKIKTYNTAKCRIEDGIYYKILSMQESGRNKYYSITDSCK